LATVKKRSVAPYYVVAAVWLLWSLFAPLYTIGHIIMAAVASVVAFLAARAIWKDKTWTTPEAEPQPAGQPKQESAAQQPKAEPKTTGNPEIDALMAERDRALSEMRRLNDNIEDETISNQIDRLELTTKKIIDAVVEKPEKLPQIRRFLNYYLPTTLKLLNAYDRMGSAGVSGVNIDGTMGKIEEMMETVCAAFDKQLDALFGDEALDISTDITVLEQMLRQEGLNDQQPFAGMN